MSLPNGFLEELRTRVTLSRLVGQKVTWDLRKSNQAKGDFWAPCPFHTEKTASFHVDDRKGYYYCFGCHAKGDAVTFLRTADNLSFTEAVEVLAREAGMAMPAADPQAAARSDRRSQLHGVMEEAVKVYRLQLRSAAGAAARAYLDSRRLTQQARDRFELGFAPELRQGLYHTLTERGIAADLLVSSGLCAIPEHGGEPYDRFRGRIIFPIRDGRGRCIALGGRALDPAAKSKYLNSPETELFDKGRSLYNHGPARDACAKGAPLVVAEGYMDVIALVEAGFHGAVAPLGTAITEDQLRLLWRISPEPLVMLDGDAAGLRAAQRLMDLALPLLEAGQGLRFVTLPQGLDPDDLLRSHGKAALEECLHAAEPMVHLLWRRETEGKVLDSPERRAALDKSLRGLVQRIADPSIRAHYAEEFKHLRAAIFHNRRPGTAQSASARAIRGAPAGRPQPLEVTKTSMLAFADNIELFAEAVILAIAARHPVLIPMFEEPLSRMELHGAGHAALLQAMLSAADRAEPNETGQVQFTELLDASARATLEKLLDLAHVKTAPPVRSIEDHELARQCLAEQLAKLEARRAVRAEVEEAVADISGLADEGVTWRLSRAADARHRAERPKLEDDGELGEDRAALSAELQRLIDAEVWQKKRH